MRNDLDILAFSGNLAEIMVQVGSYGLIIEVDELLKLEKSPFEAKHHRPAQFFHTSR